MPKLQHQDVERNQRKIEEAALRLFIHQGFHGTSVRDIADEAKVSLGNIYNYYKTKEDLFSSLVRRYEMRMSSLMRRNLVPVVGKFDEASLKTLADAVREIVYRNPDYWRLMYIDVTEFGNRHFAHSFRELSKTLMRLGGAPAKRNGHIRAGVDPELAYASIYLQFFTYFLVEKLFGGKQHLGMSDDRAVEQMILIFTQGISATDARGKPPQLRRKRV